MTENLEQTNKKNLLKAQRTDDVSCQSLNYIQQQAFSKPFRPIAK